MHCTLFGEDNGKQGRKFRLRFEYSTVELQRVCHVSNSYYYHYGGGAWRFDNTGLLAKRLTAG